jgi:hypothetical protein
MTLKQQYKLYHISVHEKCTQMSRIKCTKPTITTKGTTRTSNLILLALDHPGGTPSVTLAEGTVDTLVATTPAELVTNSVMTSREGLIVDNAETFAKIVCAPNKAVYVLLANPEDTIPPIDAGTDVLKV